MSEGTINITEQRLPVWRKLVYGAGDFASQFVWQFTGMYLTVFYTDVVGLAPMIVSAILLVARIWDVFNDPMFGAIADKTHSRWGRYRPYILFGTPLMAIASILTFTVPFGGDRAKVIWATASYIATGMLYTIVNLSYGSLSSVMSYNEQDRQDLASWRFIGASIGITVVDYIAMPLILKFSNSLDGKTATVQGYTMTMLIFCVFYVPVFLMIFKTSREVVKPVAGETVKIAVKDSLSAALHNKPFICLFFGSTLYCLVGGFNEGTIVYYIMYNVKRLDLIGLLTAIPFAVGIISLYVTKNLVKKVEKRTLIIVSLLGQGISFVAIWLIDPTNILLLLILRAFNGIFAYTPPLIFACIPECVDYGEDKTGIRNDGMAYSLISLSTKIGPAIGPSIALIIMQNTGYVANAEQTAGAQAGINFVTNGVVAIVAFVTIIPFIMYPLTKEKMKKITESLQEKLETSEK